MYKQYAEVNNLSCLLNEDKDVEILPEPFRMQKEVIFHVTYSEYKKYILSLASDTEVKLMTDITVLQTMAMQDQPRLYQCFLKDVAFAILKELYFAELYKKPATTILPASSNGNSMKLSQFVQNYNNCCQVQSELLIYMNSIGFGIPKRITTQNVRALQTAVILFYLSKQDTVKEMNLVYDAQ